MTYVDGKCGSQTLFTFKGQELSCLLPKNNFELTLNQDFIENMVIIEEETKEFLKNYYNSYILPCIQISIKYVTLKR